MAIKKTASAHWQGGIKDGKGTISTESGALKATPYGFNTRFEGQPGSNPEELLAAAHAGWPGLSAGMLEATVAAMRTPTSALQAWIGPAAGPERYEIGEDVRERFIAHDPRAAAAFVATRPGHWLVDLFAIARMRLADAGLDPAHIHGGRVCTISDPQRFFSHRRDQRSGRIATLAWIAPSAG